MLSQSSSHLKSQGSLLTQRIPTSNWSAAGMLGPDLVEDTVMPAYSDTAYSDTPLIVTL